MEQLEHPDITRYLRRGDLNGYCAETERLDVGAEEYTEIVMKRKEKENGTQSYDTEQKPYGGVS